MKQTKTYDLTMNDNTEMTEKKETCVDVRNTVTTVESNGSPHRSTPRPYANLMKWDTTTADAIKICVAEFIGTAILMYVGCMGTYGVGSDPPVWHGSLTFGLGVFLAVQTVGHISGAHLNPIVTVAALLMEKMSFPLAGIYFLGQYFGALIGYGLTQASVPVPPEGTRKAFCVTLLRDDVDLAKGLLMEIIATGLLVFLICSLWDIRNKDNTDSSSLKPGLTVFVLCLAVAPYTGCSMNPARTLAPAIITGKWKDHWVYWIGPLCGSVLASSLYKLVFSPKDSSQDLS